MGPIIRNIARYALGTMLGLLVSKGLIPQEFADQFITDPEVQTAIQGGAILTGAWVVEFIYVQAKKRGWAT